MTFDEKFNELPAQVFLPYKFMSNFHIHDDDLQSFWPFAPWLEI